MAHISCTIASLLLLLTVFFNLYSANAANFSAVFAFGDSTLDAGNNNGLTTLLRADHHPYGEDYPGGKATGRFTNGKLITDYLVSDLGLKETLPAFKTQGLSAAELSTGVSFASAGAGLDDLTTHTATVITIGQQLQNFDAYLNLMGMDKVSIDRFLADAIFVIGAGSNDMMMNFYLLPTRRSTYNVDQYQNFLLQKLRHLIQELYNKGGRKFTISGLPPIGCLPFVRSNPMAPGGNIIDRIERKCIDRYNNDSVTYNNKLQAVIKSMKGSMQGSRIAYVDVYHPLIDMIKKPSKHGFTETARGCCGSGTIEMGPLCSDPIPTCSNPNEFLFFDAVHPTQAAYEALSVEFTNAVLPQIA